MQAPKQTTDKYDTPAIRTRAKRIMALPPTKFSTASAEAKAIAASFEV